MKHVKLFENYLVETELLTETEKEYYINKLREQCIQLQSQWLLQRDDELFTKMQYKQTLIHSLVNNEALNDKDKNELNELDKLK